MSSKVAFYLGCAAVLALSPWTAVVAQEAPAQAAEAEAVDKEMEGEIAYAEALVDSAYPDFAAPVIDATKKRWPASEARLFAIEVRGMLSLGKFEDAEKKIAALPDRKGSKYWAARLEVAKSYYSRGMKAECMKIYDEFFKLFPKPPKDIRQFHVNASFEYGQLLFLDRQYAKSAKIYDALLGELKGEDWCRIASETVKVYLRCVDEIPADDKKRAKEREENLKSATKIVDKMLWQLDQPVYFGQAVSMKAHIEVMRGNVKRANEIVDENMAYLQDLHDQIVQADPDGSQGLLRLSPLPECLYLQAKMLWDQAKAEAKKTPRNDDRIKDLMFGEKPKGASKRNGKGAFNLATTVFVKYEMSPWAAPAGDLSEEIKAFAEKTYQANIKTKITPEQIAKVRAAQFKGADEKFAQNLYQEAIDEYFVVLAKYPEIPESVRAVANVSSALLDMYAEEKNAARRESYRIDADTVEGYLAERFAGHPDMVVMTSAGNAVLALAAKEKERKDSARADRLYMAFAENYTRHVNAPVLASNCAMEHQKAGRYAEAVKFWDVIEREYTNSTMYVSALAQLSTCYGKLGDKKREISYLKRYLPLEKVQLRRLQGQFRLAQTYKDDGLEILKNAETNATPEAVLADENRGSAQIIRAIQQFIGFSKEAEKALQDPATSPEDLPKYADLREKALFITGACWNRINRPEKNLTMYRERAAKSYEDYLAAYPEGQYSTNSYVYLGTVYTALGDLAKSKDALDRLSKAFPDSDAAKNAKPKLAKSLIEMGLRREGTEIYAEMLRTDGAYTPQQFVAAGDALIEAKSWDLANQSYEKAIQLAGAKFPATVARARLGQAKSSYKQGSLAEAREAIDLFLGDPNMAKLALAADANFLLVEVASEQGRAEKDDAMRAKYFGAAIGALKKVRNYWSKKERWEQDTLNLMSGDVMVDRMHAEETMGLREKAQETCGLAAATFVSFIQTHGVDEQHPLDQMSEGERANLERAYATLVPLYSKLGAASAEQVVKYGEQYLALFPEGKAKTAVQNCLNQARADLPAGGVAPAPETPAEEEAPAAE